MGARELDVQVCLLWCASSPNLKEWYQRYRYLSTEDLKRVQTYLIFVISLTLFFAFL